MDVVNKTNSSLSWDAMPWWWNEILSCQKWMDYISTVITLRKNNMDTQNDGLEKVTPFKHGKFGYLC